MINGSLHNTCIYLLYMELCKYKQKNKKIFIFLTIFLYNFFLLAIASYSLQNQSY